jgi:chromosome segregation ATPase
LIDRTDVIEEDLSVLTGRVDQTEDDIDAIDVRVQDIQDQVDENSGDIDTLKVQVDDLVNSLDATKDNVALLSTEYEALAAVLDGHIDALNAQIVLLTEDPETNAEDILANLYLITTMQASSNNLQSARSRLMLRVKTLATRVGTAEADTEKLKVLVGQLEEDVVSLRSDLDVLTARVAVTETSITGLENDIQVLKADISALEDATDTSLTALQVRIDTFIAGLGSTKTSVPPLRRDYVSNVSAISNRLNDLQGWISSLINRDSSLQSQISALVGKDINLQAAINELQSEINDFTFPFLSLVTRIESMEERVRILILEELTINGKCVYQLPPQEQLSEEQLLTFNFPNVAYARPGTIVAFKTFIRGDLGDEREFYTVTTGSLDLGITGVEIFEDCNFLHHEETFTTEASDFNELRDINQVTIELQASSRVGIDVCEFNDVFVRLEYEGVGCGGE